MPELDDVAENRVSRHEQWLWLNLVAAVAIIVLLFFFDVGLYLRLVAGGEFVAVGFLVALPVLGWWIFENRYRESARVVWAMFAAAVLLLFASAAILDAERLRYYNCWVLNKQTGGTPRFVTWECVPGSAPKQGEWFDEERGDGSYASCDLVNETSSGGTIWRCEYGDL